MTTITAIALSIILSLVAIFICLLIASYRSERFEKRVEEILNEVYEKEGRPHD